jgi:hypothetical protein
VGRALDLLGAGELRGLVPRTLVVFTAHDRRGHRTPDVRPAREILRDVGADVAALNYDRHLAAGTAMDPSRIGYATRVAAMGIAAQALRRALPDGPGE